MARIVGNRTRYPVHDKAEMESFEYILKTFQNTLDIIHGFGVSIDPQCRLSEYFKVLKEYTDSKNAYENLDDLNRFSFALREIREIIEIIEGVGDTPTKSEHNIITELSQGCWHPDEDTNTRVRDQQYELWLKHFLSKHNIISKIKEPDLFFKWNGKEFPLAAKRPKSRKSLDGRIRSAVHQLEPYKGGGVVSISLDLLLRPKYRDFYAVSPLEAGEKMDLLFIDLLQWLISSESPIMKRGKGSNIIAYLLTGRLNAFIREHGVFCMETRAEFFWITNDNRHLSLSGFRNKVSSYKGTLSMKK